MPATHDSSPFEAAVSRLEKALSMLENALESQIERQGDVGEFEEEVQRMNADRSRLAQELDDCEARAERLEQANREVSRRLITTMETIRGALEH